MRYKCICQYDGTLFHGFQAQGNLRTIQGEIERVLKIINRKEVSIHPSGRTDAGVHALGQVFHFDSEVEIEESKYLKTLNSGLSKDIYISSLEKVNEDFHSRHDCLSREYHYLIDFGKCNLFLRNYRYYCNFQDIDKIKFKDAFSVFVGRHDFRSYTKNKKKYDTIRTIFSIDFEEEGTLIKIKFIGDGFLHNQIRILVGMALEVGRSKCSKEDLKLIMEARDRTLAPKNVPPQGLYLKRVYY